MSVNVREGHRAQGKTGGQSFRSIADWEMGRGCKKKLIDTLPVRHTLACPAPHSHFSFGLLLYQTVSHRWL